MLTQDRIKREIYEAREKARRDAEDWRSALQRAEQRLQTTFLDGREEGREEGRQEGLAEGLIGQIRLCERLLQRTPKPDGELAAMSADELRELVQRLQAELFQGRTSDSPD